MWGFPQNSNVEILMPNVRAPPEFKCGNPNAQCEGSGWSFLKVLRSWGGALMKVISAFINGTPQNSLVLSHPVMKQWEICNPKRALTPPRWPPELWDINLYATQAVLISLQQPGRTIRQRLCEHHLNCPCTSGDCIALTGSNFHCWIPFQNDTLVLLSPFLPLFSFFYLL